MNETIASMMVNGSIPVSVTMNTPFKMSDTLVSTLISIALLLILMYAPKVIGFISVGSLNRISRFTKRNVVMIKHTDGGLFQQSMIDGKCLRQISRAMNKMKGEDFDLILHTPGGSVFDSLAISRMIKQYPGKIRAIIPLYSMSGGSLLALSCKEIMMTPNACLGPIDPQLGSFFKFGSAKAWDEIVKFKGRKAEDQSISFAMMGRQYTKSICNHLNMVIDFGLAQDKKDKLIQFLTDGSIEHAYPLTITDLNRFGLEPRVLQNPKFLEVLDKIVSSNGREGVHYYKISNWRKKSQQ